MTPLHNELTEVGKRLRRWQAMRRFVAWSAVAVACLCALTLLDFVFRYERSGRLASWAVLVAVVAVAVVYIWKALSARFTPQGVAASVEKAFPKLDNHLINYIQFADTSRKGPFETAYVQGGVPEWREIDIRAMKNRRAHRRAWIALLMCGLVTLAPGFWSGPAWSNAILRIVNPFSNRMPVTLAQIREVKPGDRVVVQGSPVVLSCKVEGRRGQPVEADVWPSDDKKSTVKIGELAGTGVEAFSFRIDDATTDTRYRFRAGDAYSRAFQIRVRPPLAFTAVSLEVTPAPYTKAKPQKFDALAGDPVISEDAGVVVALTCNYPLSSLTCAVGDEKAEMKPSDGGRTWRGNLRIRSEKDIHIAATDVDGFNAETDAKFRFVPDRLPVIQVLAPVGPAILGPGTPPRIQCQISDDYGVAQVEIQKISTGAGATNVQPVQKWDAGTQREFAVLWTGAIEKAAANVPVAFRIVATDSYAGEKPHRVESPLIVFNSAGAEQTLDQEKKAGADSAAALDKLIALQTENLDRTRKLDATIQTATAQQWKEPAAVQADIRRLAGTLLADPRKPLGTLHSVMDRLFQKEMVEATDLLRRIPEAPVGAKKTLAGRSVAVEMRILESLKRTDSSVARIKEHREITGLLAMLDALVTGQKQTLDGTRACLRNSARVEAPLVDKQDALSGDLADFVQTCRKESKTLEREDAEFSQLIVRVADTCETKKVSPNMIRAAEKLEGNAPAEAAPLEEQALTVLKECQDLMNNWRVADAKEKMNELRDVVEQTKLRIQKLKAVQAKVVDTLREVDQQKDMSREEYDQIQEEVAELKENVKDAALEIAKDLHIFPELPVGNDLVEDVSQVFEETAQEPGSDKAKADELGLQKEDWILEGLEKAEGRMDDMEMWLTAKPDATKRNTENFDKTELPKIPVLPMPTELEDIIGDLLKQEEKEKEKADDSATNQGSADIPAGWDIAEGEFVNYSAKGKSGNETPEHKDQDGRSQIGRQGMSDGESVAGSGKINEGDPNMEKRRTRDSAQSGQIQEEGHSEAKATGGGKLSGYATESGMAGAGPRRDSTMQGSELGLQAMLRRNAEALYGKASLMHIRTGALDEAVVNMRRAEEAMAGGRIQQVREFQRRAVVALKKTQAELGAGVVTEAMEMNQAEPPVEETVAGMADEAPSNYRDLVAEYFKSLSEAPR